MITLRYQHLFNDGFILACHALKNTRFRDFKAPRNALLILQGVEKETTTAKELYKQQFEPFLEMGENGQPIAHKSDFAPFKIKEGKEEEYKTKFIEFLKTEFQIDAEKINGDMILEAKLSPVMVGILADVFE